MQTSLRDGFISCRVSKAQVAKKKIAYFSTFLYLLDTPVPSVDLGDGVAEKREDLISWHPRP